MKKNYFVHDRCFLVLATFLFLLFFFFWPTYAFCQDDYVLANELIDFLRNYCPDEPIKVRNYWALVHYLRTDWGDLSGFTLLEHFTGFSEDSLTEDFLAAGIEE